ncbi:MAG: hypothetical protein AB1918_19205 [Pseudomonadota bacterium]
MDKHDAVCPHCGSTEVRVVADNLGRVGWCAECCQAWIADRAPPPERSVAVRAAA